MGKDKGGGGGKAQAAKEAAEKKAVADSKAKGVEAMEVRHILVEKHGKAAEIIEIIKSGKMGFNEAAREYSMDKAGKSGLLGWKRKPELDQDFWAAALEVPEGKYTEEPVKTQYGYHIIMVQARK
uniref:Peptidyl-prolyl cis-trans isomerase n=1 Tax=Hemiselmis tepida TaxID=464990 RepID=A0A7S0V7B3_9CRYP|mmetsp:Transcript_1075/g.2731  ORF Transcript_1075/g.2731 Transcript_1075/m.2731 type:complete len:125 (+) Transcript_1075:24-398(+)